MTVTDLKELVKKFGKTLDDKKPDEWWDTDKNVWDEISKKFIQWVNSNRKLLNVPQKKEENGHK